MSKTTGTVASVAFMATRDQKQRLVNLGYKKKAEVDKMTPQQIQDTLKLHDLGHSKDEIAAMTTDQVQVILNPPQSDQAGEDFNINAIIDDFNPFDSEPEPERSDARPPRARTQHGADPGPELPRDPDMERLVLGALLLSGSTERIRETAANLSPDVFMANNQEIYRTLCWMAEQGESINPVVLRRRLVERGSRVEAATVTALLDDAPIRSDLSTEIKILRDLATCRAILRESQQWFLDAQGRNVDVDALVDRIQSRTAKLRVIAPRQTTRIAVSWGEACLMEFPPLENILNGIERGEVINWSAVTDRGKSTICRNIAISLACGREFAPVVRAGKPRCVLYLDFETPWRKLNPDITKMLSELTQAERAMISTNLHIIADCRVDNWPLSLSLNPHWEILESEMRRVKPDMVFIDTLTTAFDIDNENDNGEATRVMKKLTALAEKYDCVIVFLHHIGKTRQEEGGGAQSVYRSRGGSAYEGCSHAVVYMLPYSGDDDRFTLKCAKLKGEKWPNTVFKISKESRWCLTDNAPAPAPSSTPETDKTSYQQVLDVFNGQPLKTGEIKKLLVKSKLSDRAIEDHLAEALRRGDLLKLVRGVYQKVVSSAQQNPLLREAQEAQTPIGGAESALRPQVYDSAEDRSAKPIRAKNGFCGITDETLEADFSNEDRYLDAIAE